MTIAKTVSENFEDEELRRSYVELAIDLYALKTLFMNPTPFRSDIALTSRLPV